MKNSLKNIGLEKHPNTSAIYGTVLQPNQPTKNIGIYIIWANFPIIPKPELRGFGGDSLTKPPLGVTSAEVVIICPEYCLGNR